MATAEQEGREFELRMAQMQADIDLKRDQQRKVQQDWRLDTQRVLIPAVLATAAVMGGIAGLLGYIIGHASH